MTKIPFPIAKMQVWSTRSISCELFNSDTPAAIKKTERWLSEQGLNFSLLTPLNLTDEQNRRSKVAVTEQSIENARKKRKSVFFAAIHTSPTGTPILFANDGRNGRRWIVLNQVFPSPDELQNALEQLCYHENKDILIIPTGSMVSSCRDLTKKWQSNEARFKSMHKIRIGLESYSHSCNDFSAQVDNSLRHTPKEQMSHLDHLEAEAIHIIREVIAEAEKPVMLYSAGKDSSVMLHLARKAFYPSSPPFPLLHIDTQWKFQAMYDFRDHMVKVSGMNLLIHTNPEGQDRNINPFDHGPALHTDIMKIQALTQALDHYKFDVAFSGARRDEETSRDQERIFSSRTSNHRGASENQHPELWRQYNIRKTHKESLRVFPLSNWTELDIWQYIYREQIPVVPLYFSAERPIIQRDDMLIMVDDDRLKLYPNEKIQIRKVRFRTLGCYPLTGAIESEADDIASIVLELINIRTSERQDKAIDADTTSSMEKKKQEGYL